MPFFNTSTEELEYEVQQEETLHPVKNFYDGYEELVTRVDDLWESICHRPPENKNEAKLVAIALFELAVKVMQFYYYAKDQERNLPK